MLRAAGRLIRADLRERRLQTALTGLVVAIAACALLVTLHLRDVMSEPFDDLMRGTNGAHVIVSGPPGAVAEAAELPEVAEAGAPRRLVRVAAGDAAARLVVSELPADAAIDRPLLTDGRLPRRAGEVALLAPLAFGTGRRPGDEIRLGGERLEVVGVAVTAIPSADAWVAPEQLGALTPAPPDEGEPIGGPLAVGNPPRARRRRRPAPARSGGGHGRRRAARRERPRARRRLARGARRLHRRRAPQPRHPGELHRARPARHRLHAGHGDRRARDRRPPADRAAALRRRHADGRTALLVGHYATVALLAAPFGLLAGRLLAPALLDDSLGLLGMSPPGPPSPAITVVALLLVLAAVALACALPAWRAGRLPPVVALQPTRGGARRASRAARAARALRLPVTGALGAKDAYIRPVRATLTVASLALAAAMVVCVLAFEATIDRLVANPALEGEPWDVAVYTEAMRPAEVDRLLASVPELRVVGRRYDLLAVAGGIELETRAIDGPPGDFAFVVPDGRGVQRAGEVTLGAGALEALGAEIGDTVELAVDGRRFEARIVGRHVEPSNDGRGAVLLADTVPPAALRRPSWIMRLDPGADPARVTAAIDRLGEGRLAVDRPPDSAAANPVRLLVYGVATLLLAIAAVNLLTTLLLGVRERRRDLAVLGAVGASRRQLTSTVVSGGLVLAVPAVLIGLPLGAVLFTTIVRLTDNADGADVATLPSWLTIALALPVALAAVALVSALAAREATRVAIAPALRAE